MKGSKLRFYKAGEGDIRGVIPGHVDGDFTFLPHRTEHYTWIRTRDLHKTLEEAEKAEIAKFDR